MNLSKPKAVPSWPSKRLLRQRGTLKDRARCRLIWGLALTGGRKRKDQGESQSEIIGKRVRPICPVLGENWGKGIPSLELIKDKPPDFVEEPNGKKNKAQR